MPPHAGTDQTAANFYLTSTVSCEPSMGPDYLSSLVMASSNRREGKIMYGTGRLLLHVMWHYRKPGNKESITACNGLTQRRIVFQYLPRKEVTPPPPLPPAPTKYPHTNSFSSSVISDILCLMCVSVPITITKEGFSCLFPTQFGLICSTQWPWTEKSRYRR